MVVVAVAVDVVERTLVAADFVDFAVDFVAVVVDWRRKRR